MSDYFQKKSPNVSHKLQKFDIYLPKFLLKLKENTIKYSSVKYTKTDFSFFQNSKRFMFYFTFLITYKYSISFKIIILENKWKLFGYNRIISLWFINTILLCQFYVKHAHFYVQLKMCFEFQKMKTPFQYLPNFNKYRQLKM